MPIDPDAGITDLVRRLGDDSKRLMTDEVELAKLEMHESLARAARGGIRLVLAFGVMTVMLVALTLMLATLIGRVANGHMWIGAVVTGIAELALGFSLFRKGVTAFGAPKSLPQTRESLKDTRNWVSDARVT
ncbi:MAG: hypothetical protein JWO05_2623 [Gemmatimonadetes bacterium]|nr:hypothetical protein [Gemmatimonadota bacterium]